VVVSWLVLLSAAAALANEDYNEGVGSGDCGCGATNRGALVLEREDPKSKGADEQAQKEVSCSAPSEPMEQPIAAQQEIVNDLVRIPAGYFIMGTDFPAIIPDGEGPARQVFVSEFDLHRYEVSVHEFAQFIKDTEYVTEAETFGWSFCFINSLSEKTLASVDKQVEQIPWWVPVSGADWAHPNGPDSSSLIPERRFHPVTHVSHNDAREYCEWAGMRLPREAEFERAMRGGLENASFPWGDDLTPNGVHRANLWQGQFPSLNTAEDGFEWTSPINSFGPQNEFGLFNIVGNAWEWVADAFVANHAKYLAGAPLVDPQVELQGQVESKVVERVKRGGSYLCHESYCYRYRTASRSHNSADSSAQNLGFRCAKNV